MNSPVSSSSSMLKASIHLERLRKNISLVQEHVPEHVRIMGVVKCNAYSHGAVPVATTMTNAGVRELVVSNIAEGLTLRKAGIVCPILVLSDPLYPRLEDALDHNLTITLSDTDFARKILDLTAGHCQPLNVHVKIDTGLGRFGLSPDETMETMDVLFKARHINVTGIYSHLACTFKNNARCNSFTRTQIETFNAVLDKLSAKGMLPSRVHLGSSTGLLGFPEELCSGRFSALRIGTLFFGFTEREHNWDKTPLPVAEVTTRIMQVRELKAGSCFGYHLDSHMPYNGRIAVINGGLYHGLHGDFRMVPAFMVNGRTAPVMGRLSMAQTIIDITTIPEARVGTEVVLAGKELNMHELARSMGRGTWEIFLPMLEKAEKTYHQ